MRKHTYESAVIINAALEDEQIELVVTKLQDAIIHNGGENLRADKWGRKRLAYQIKKSKIGYYVIFQFEAPVEAIALIERVYRLDETILRFLTIKLSKFAIEHFSDQKEKEALEKIAEEPIGVAVTEPEVAVTPEELDKTK